MSIWFKDYLIKPECSTIKQKIFCILFVIRLFTAKQKTKKMSSKFSYTIIFPGVLHLSLSLSIYIYIYIYTHAYSYKEGYLCHTK